MKEWINEKIVNNISKLNGKKNQSIKKWSCERNVIFEVFRIAHYVKNFIEIKWKMDMGINIMQALENQKH